MTVNVFRPVIIEKCKMLHSALQRHDAAVRAEVTTDTRLTGE